MASKLYNVLRSIDNHRLSMIDSLRNKGFNMTRDDSFGSINAKIDSLEPHYQQPYVPNEYFDNPEDDPLVWDIPKDWLDLDLESILKSKEVFTRIENDVEISMYPACIYLLRTDQESTIFSLVTSMTATFDTTATNTVRIGFNPNSSYKTLVSLEFNDGTLYHYPGEAWGTQLDYTHIWDHSKDIISTNGTAYKYIIGYQSNRHAITSTSNMSNSSLLYYRVFGLPQHLLDEITFECAFFNAAFARNSTYSITTELCSLKYIKVCSDGFSYDNTRPETPEKYNMLDFLDAPGIYLTVRNYLRRLEFELPKNRIFNNAGPTLYTYTNSSYPYNTLNTLILPASNLSTSFIYYPSVVWVKCNSIKASAITYSSPQAHSDIALKYLDILDEELQASYAGTATTSGRLCVSHLRDISAFTRQITSLSTADYYRSILQGRDYVDFSYVTSFSSGALANAGWCNILDLSGLTSTYLPNLRQIFCNKLILTGISTLSERGFSYAGHNTSSRDQFWMVKEIDLSSLTTVSGTIGYLNPGGNAGSVTEVVNVSALTSLSIDVFFNNLYCLKTLRLPNDFKYNLNINGCLMLTRECAIDILNKTAPLEEGETFTLKLPNKFRGASYIDEEFSEALENAKEKGWTVTLTN